MKLFDDNVRTYDGLREPRESIYQFLNRSARPEYEETRNLLEKWFQDYPEPYNMFLLIQTGPTLRMKRDPALAK